MNQKIILVDKVLNLLFVDFDVRVSVIIIKFQENVFMLKLLALH